MPASQPVITNLQIWPVCEPHGRRCYVIIRVDTDAGIDGWGEVAVRADAGAVVKDLETCRHRLIGQDASRVEHVQRLLEDKAPGTQLKDVLAGVNMAQLDILGKLCRAPAYLVLGGPTRSKVRAMAPLTGQNEETLLASLAQARQAGFRAMRIPLLLTDGPTRGRSFFDRVRKQLDRFRSASGGEIDFVLDCAGRTTPSDAVSLARALEYFHLLWLDEPTSQIQQKALSSLGEEAATPIGWGLIATDIPEFQDLLRQDAVDVLRPDVARFGITSIRKAAAIAETYYVAVAPRHAGGPLGTAAALQIAASIPNFFIQEVPFPGEEADRRMRRDLAGDLETPKDGFFSLPTAPGLGITISEDALRKHSIKV